MKVASFLVILLVKNAVAENVPGDLFKPAYFDVQLDRIEQLYSDLEYCDWSGLKVRKVNKTRSIIGEIKFFKPFGNDIMTEGKAYKKQGNEYRLLPFHLPQEPYCDIAVKDSTLFNYNLPIHFNNISALVYIYPDMAKGSDLPEDVMANCPLTPVILLISFCKSKLMI